MTGLVKPSEFRVIENKIDEGYLYGRYEIEPLDRGFGHTIGNVLRRILLSSIPSIAVTQIKIKDKFHEYDTIKGVKEDILEIILNIKKLQLKLEVEDVEFPIKLIVEKKGAGTFYAKDIQHPSFVEISNPEQYLFTSDDDADIYIELFVEAGKGYYSVETRSYEPEDMQVIPIDAIFSPVVKVNFLVENTMFAERTDYDKLIIEIWTKRSIKPIEALEYAMNVLRDYSQVLVDISSGKEIEIPSKEDVSSKEIETAIPQEQLEEKAIEDQKEEIESDDRLSLGIDALELSARSANCLKRGKVKTIGDLLSKSTDDLLKLRNFGMKSLEEIKQKLEKFDLKLKDPK
jgi:DNA-directed RNA polymerase subunit alpha